MMSKFNCKLAIYLSLILISINSYANNSDSFQKLDILKENKVLNLVDPGYSFTLPAGWRIGLIDQKLNAIQAFKEKQSLYILSLDFSSAVNKTKDQLETEGLYFDKSFHRIYPDKSSLEEILRPFLWKSLTVLVAEPVNINESQGYFCLATYAPDDSNTSFYSYLIILPHQSNENKYYLNTFLIGGMGLSLEEAKANFLDAKEKLKEIVSTNSLFDKTSLNKYWSLLDSFEEEGVQQISMGKYGYGFDLPVGWEVLRNDPSIGEFGATKSFRFLRFKSYDFEEVLLDVAVNKQASLDNKKRFHRLFPDQTALNPLVTKLFGDQIKLDAAIKISESGNDGFMCLASFKIDNTNYYSYLILIPTEQYLHMLMSGIKAKSSAEAGALFVREKDELRGILSSVDLLSPPQKKGAAILNSELWSAHWKGLFSIVVVGWLLILWVLLKTGLRYVAIFISLLFSIGISALSVYTMVNQIMKISFHWTWLLALTLAAIFIYFAVRMIGGVLNKQYKNKLDNFLNSNSTTIKFNRTEVSVYSFLILSLFPFLVFVLLFSLFSALTFAVYGYILITYLPRVPIGILIGFVAVIVVAAFALLYGLFRLMFPGGDSKGAMQISRDVAPGLWGMIDHLALELNTKPISKVLVAADLGMSVHLQGPTFLTLFGRGKRVLSIGMSSIEGLSSVQLQAIVAHEYAHFCNRDTSWSVFTYSMGTALLQAFRAIPNPFSKSDSEGSWFDLVMMINPSFWALLLFINLYFKVTGGFSRISEVQADLRAIEVVGGAAFKGGLLGIATNNLIYSSFVENKVLTSLIDEESVFENFSELMKLVKENMKDSELAEIQEELLKSEAEDSYDSHPNLAVRLKYAEKMTTLDREVEAVPVSTLFSDWEELNKKAADIYYTILIGKLKKTLAAQDKPSEDT